MNPQASTFTAAGVEVFLYLDFDGVINHFPRAFTAEDEANPDRYTNVEKGEGRTLIGGDPDHFETWPLHWSPDLIADLNDVLSDKRVQLIWLTSWEENIISVQEDLLKLRPANPARVLTLRRKFSDYRSIHAKFTAWEEFNESLEEDVASYIWIDDDVIPLLPARLEADFSPPYFFDEDAINETAVADNKYKNTFAIAPHTILGLQPSHLAEIKNFLNSVLNEEEDHDTSSGK